jgi:hypothetical protein
MVFADRPEKIMGHEDLRWRWFERSKVALERFELRPVPDRVCLAL